MDGRKRCSRKRRDGSTHGLKTASAKPQRRLFRHPRSFTGECFMRGIDFCDAIREAMWQEMERDPAVFVYGIGVPTHAKIFGSVRGLSERFGPERCFDTPISEEAMTGFGLGAAINGLRPIHIHIRVDFLLLAINQLVNMVSTFSYSTRGQVKVPLVIRAVVGRGWGQGYQHSK